MSEKSSRLLITPELQAMHQKVQGLIADQLMANQAKGNPETTGTIKTRFATGLKNNGRTEEEINFLVYNIQ
jgi:hypothetical protein